MAVIPTTLRPEVSRFPVGASVGIYLLTQWPGKILVGAPIGAAVETAVVAADGSIPVLGTGTDDTFPDGVPPKEYVGYLATPDRYIRFVPNKQRALYA